MTGTVCAKRNERAVAAWTYLLSTSHHHHHHQGEYFEECKCRRSIGSLLPVLLTCGHHVKIHERLEIEDEGFFTHAGRCKDNHFPRHDYTMPTANIETPHTLAEHSRCDL